MPRRIATLALAVPLLVACASVRTVPEPVAGSGDSIFGVPPEAIGTQTLYRVRIEDEGGRGSLRLVLRLWRTDRFELAASDSFGRPLWRLVIHEGRGLWIEGGDDSVCRVDPERPLRWPRLSLVLPPGELPTLLLGRLPGSPGPGGPPAIGTGSEVVDGSGRHWTVSRDAEGLRGWSVGSGAGRLAWTREAGGAALEVGTGEIRIDWRASSREPVAGTAPALPVGAGTASECAFEELS